MTRPKKHLTSATKSNGITITMPYWDERFAAMGEELSRDPHRPVPHRHPVRAFRAASGLVRRGGGHPTCSATSCAIWARRWRARSASPPSANINPERKFPVDVRAGARLGARHRRQVHLQPDRPDLVGGADAGAPGRGARPARRSSMRSRRCCARAGRRRATWAARPAPRMSARRWRNWWRGSAVETPLPALATANFPHAGRACARIRECCW